MTEKYILMNQNKEVLKFEFDKELNVIIGINEIYDINFAPLNIKNIDSKKRTSTLNTWFNDRGIPIYRDNVTGITDIFGIDSIKQLINRNYALSVQDQYWFKPENSDIEWEKINRLKSLDEKYENMLKEYREYTKLTDEEIELLVNGYQKRIECFEKIVNTVV